MTRHSLLIQKKAFKGSWTSFWMLLLTKDWRSTARRPFAWWSRRKGSLQRTTLYGTGIEQVNSFNYLGSMLTSDGRCEKEIRRRIARFEIPLVRQPGTSGFSARQLRLLILLSVGQPGSRQAPSLVSARHILVSDFNGIPLIQSRQA